MKGLAKNTYRAKIRIAQETGGSYLAEVIRRNDRLKGLFAFGDTSDEAVTNLLDVLRLALNSGDYFAKGRFTEIHVTAVAAPVVLGTFPATAGEQP